MKLYATITSEKKATTARKGGNEYLEIKLYRGNYMLGYLTLNNEALVYQSNKTPETLDYLEETKGKKQKGDCTGIEVHEAYHNSALIKGEICPHCKKPKQ